MSTAVDDFFQRINNLLSITEKEKETSLYIWASDYLTRSLILVTANYFENEFMQRLGTFMDGQSSSPLLKAFLEKSLERKYFTFFDWTNPKGNANNFFSLFGEEFKNKACADVQERQDLKEGIRSFIELGYTRNNLVHKRPDEVSLTKTAAEYYELYKKALVFIDYVQQELK